jgi:hypothetical protein
MRKIVLFLVLLTVLPISAKATQHGESPRLKVVNKGTTEALIYYGERPVFAFGPSHQRTFSLLGPASSKDINEWVKWAAQYRITNVRSYPPTQLIADGSLRVFQQAATDPEKIDLTKFNPEYFKELRRVCELLRDNGIIVHLQFWQAVGWRKNWWDRWELNYYNPVNNVNPDIARNAGPGKFVTMKNPVLLSHQKEYVRRILDATGDLGNVFYDIMNEIGNGVGTSERWVEEIIDTVRQWERERGLEVLLTLNDEGGMRMGEFSLSNPRLDLVLLDQGRYHEHVQARMKYKKPTIGVRNLDFDRTTGKRTYFYGVRDMDKTIDPSLQSRGRRVWWRMFMALVQSNGGYSDVVHEQRTLDLQAEHAVLHFRNFIDSIQSYAALRISPEAIEAAPGGSTYCLQSGSEVIVYSEAPSGRAGISYNAGTLKLRNLALADGEHKVVIYDPLTGSASEKMTTLTHGSTQIDLPGFTDDIAVHLYSTDTGDSR